MNPDEQAAASARVAALFDRVAQTYDNVGVPWFTPIGRWLVGQAAPALGERALDVGCGRGAALLPLAEAVGPTGRVTGIDLAPNMVAASQAEVTARGLPNVDLHVMNAMAPELPAASYDLVVSSLVLFFLPDPAAALRSWRELVVPGGRLAVSTFADRDPLWESIDSLFRPYLPPAMLDARTSGATGPFGSDGGVEQLLAAAGFTSARTTHFDADVVFADADQWHAFSWSHGQRAMWEAVPEGDRPAIRARVGEALEGGRRADGRIHLTQRVRATVADRN